MMLFGKLRNDEQSDDCAKKKRKTESSDERMVIRHLLADGSIRYEVTDALLKRAAQAASRKNLEAA